MSPQTLKNNREKENNYLLPLRKDKKGMNPIIYWLRSEKEKKKKKINKSLYNNKVKIYAICSYVSITGIKNFKF